MGKKLLCMLMALITVLAVFSGCNKNPSSDETTTLSGEGGSDIVEENLTTTRKPVSAEKLIAITFDDGPHKTYTNRILDILEKNGATATFFLVGYNIENNIDTIKRAADLGCEIANHSLSHKNLMKISDTEISKQVKGPNEMVKSLADIDVKLFRAPGGNFDGVTDKIGMPLIQWSIDTEDWKYKDAAHKDRSEEQRNADLDRISKRVIEKADKGDIILMHDIYGFTADLCEIIIPALVEKGFRVVSVSEMYDAYGKSLEAGKVYYSVDFAEGNTIVVEPGNYKVKTKGSVLNIRTEPKSDADSLAKLPNGTPIKVVDCIEGWAKVEYNTVVGWVNTAYIEAAE
ncbi:MAG: polysaccharide deacetylase family protein [Clostridia bacterium]|nr:polysaccharide deacetylase family protein [Clostridia bacterium]